MRTYAGLSLLLIVSLTASGQDQPTPVTPPEDSAPTKELRKIAGSDPIKTFAEAFLDPNVIIGVFEYPKEITTTGVPTDQVLEGLDGYWAAQEKFGIRMLRCVKAIKGNLPMPAVFVCDRLAPAPPQGLRIPSFVPISESKWILALEKTTRRSRVAKFGEEINTYSFLDDRTLFRQFHYGYGALCLQWPAEDEGRAQGPRNVLQVPETLLDDFADIQRVLPYACKDNITVSEAAAIGLAWKAMKTSMGRSVLGRVLETGPVASR